MKDAGKLKREEVQKENKMKEREEKEGERERRREKKIGRGLWQSL